MSSLSLVERKKQQWAKEREELARISGYWRQSSEPQYYQSALDRNRYASKLSMVQSSNYERHSKDIERRSSLPPLYKNQYNSNYEREKVEGGETSGYGSDNTPEYPQIQWNQSGYESSSSRDDRPKWGDKGVGVGKFWSPKDDISEKSGDEPPNWVKRGLEDGQIVVSNTSPAESPEQAFEEQERPCTTGSSSSNNRSYIRGQNIPIDSTELAERERRRQLALAHQQAIREQLEEREKKRREERERRIKEEREEELRIEREQEEERRRQEEEQRLVKEKLERERKRKEAIQEALEIAQKEAKLEKMKQKMSKHTNQDDNYRNTMENVVQVVKVPETEETTVDVVAVEEDSNKKVLVDEDIPNNLKSTNEVKPTTPKTINNNLQRQESNLVRTPKPDYQALIFQSPLEILQSIPYAVLVPNLNPGTPMPIAIPMVNQETSTTRTENRLLTPTQYRNRNLRVCDSSTQTDAEYFAEPSDNRSSRKGRRSRNEERRSESVEERPKWGANRPPTRYLKQSEKDLLYQRRKMRQKIRGTKPTDDKYSSDESQIGSPRIYRKKGYPEKRNTRALWQKKDQNFPRLYQTEIVPLECDKDSLYYKECCCRCRCRCDRQNVKVDILKIEHNSPRESMNYKPENTTRLPDCISLENNDILDKLATLHNGLMLKQEQWKNSPRTPSLTSLRQNDN